MEIRKSVIRLAGAAVVAALALAAQSMEATPRVATGIAVGVISLVMLIMSRRELGKSFSVRAEAKSLVTTGVYSKIEHPLYTFLDFFLIGVILILGWPLLLIAWGILVVVHVIEARREEKVLSAAFGAGYLTYRTRTWF